MPPAFEDRSHSKRANTHVNELSGTAQDSKASRSVARTNVATRTRKSDRTTDPHPSSASPPDGTGEAGTDLPQLPSKQRVPGSNAKKTSVPRATKKAMSSLHPPTSTPIVEDPDATQATEAPQPGTLEGSSPAVNLAHPPRPRRQARDKAVDLIRKCQAPKTKRGSGIKTTPSAARQRKAKSVRGIQQTDVDGNDTTDIEAPSVIPNEAILPTTGIPPHSSNDLRLY